MDPEFRELVQDVLAALREIEKWMNTYVRGFREDGTRSREFRDNRYSYATELAWYLRDGRCDCGLHRCGDQHTLAAQPASGLLCRDFVRRAIIGPAGLLAGSIVQGMLYRHILRDELGMLVAPVELKRCHECQQLYELMLCYREGCGAAYTPQETEVMGQERLIIMGVYVPVRRWGCGGSHYYRQDRCREEITAIEPRISHGIVHAEDGQHDTCPWCGCPHGNPPHAPRGRGTTLWVRQDLVSPQDRPSLFEDPSQGPFINALEEAAAEALAALGEESRQRVHEAIGNDPSVCPEYREEPMVMADWLLDHGRSVLTREERQRFMTVLRRVLRRHGYDLEDEDN